MRASLIETQQIENFLSKSMTVEELENFNFQILSDGTLYEKVLWQQQVYEYVECYSRIKLKEEIDQAHKMVFGQSYFSKFRQTINLIFNQDLRI